jgi:hypothetical protein
LRKLRASLLLNAVRIAADVPKIRDKVIDVLCMPDGICQNVEPLRIPLCVPVAGQQSLMDLFPLA